LGHLDLENLVIISDFDIRDSDFPTRGVDPENVFEIKVRSNAFNKQ